MKRAMFSLLVGVVFIGLAGCVTDQGHRPLANMGDSAAQGPENGQSCDPGLCRQCLGRGCGLCRGAGLSEPGPLNGAVTYPYYTTRGPRDFLMRNPPSIGP